MEPEWDRRRKKGEEREAGGEGVFIPSQWLEANGKPDEEGTYLGIQSHLYKVYTFYRICIYIRNHLKEYLKRNLKRHLKRYLKRHLKRHDKAV
jgi:hypothetical protein